MSGIDTLSPQVLAPHFEAVERRLNVATWPLEAINENNRVLWDGLGALGDERACIRRNVAWTASRRRGTGTWVHGNDRQGLERLVRYGARGPVAESRLSRLADGRYRYAPKGDGPPVDFTAEALVRRLVALLPPAHKHLTTFHGV